MGTLWQDIRYGLRTLARNPGFTTVIVLVLGLGIGVTTAVFSVVSAVLLRPLPFPNVDRLVMVWETEKGRPGSLEAIMLLRFLDWRDQCPDFEAMAYHQGSFKLVTLSELKGHWALLCFYPGDFTFV